MNDLSVIRESVSVHAPLARLFALSTRVELVKDTLQMNPVGGLISGHVTMDSRVLWRGWKFGLPTEHHTLITGYSAPQDGQAWFQDTQERGRFAFFQHDHWFREAHASDGSAVTVLEDEVRFRLPFGILGRLVARLILEPHVRSLTRRRFATLKALAEGDGWRQWVAPS